MYTVYILYKHRRFAKSALKRMTNRMVKTLRANVTVEEALFSASLTALLALNTFLGLDILVIADRTL